MASRVKSLKLTRYFMVFLCISVRVCFYHLFCRAKGQQNQNDVVVLSFVRSAVQRTEN